MEDSLRLWAAEAARRKLAYVDMLVANSPFAVARKKGISISEVIANSQGVIELAEFSKGYRFMLEAELSIANGHLDDAFRHLEEASLRIPEEPQLYLTYGKIFYFMAEVSKESGAPYAGYLLNALDDFQLAKGIGAKGVDKKILDIVRELRELKVSEELIQWQQ